ncbi:MAG: hypothetical protein ACREBR_05035 [bacterium]
MDRDNRKKLVLDAIVDAIYDKVEDQVSTVYERPTDNDFYTVTLALLNDLLNRKAK